jgi:hypothetical protein
MKKFWMVTVKVLVGLPQAVYQHQWQNFDSLAAAQKAAKQEAQKHSERVWVYEAVDCYERGPAERLKLMTGNGKVLDR